MLINSETEASRTDTESIMKNQKENLNIEHQGVAKKKK